MSVTRVVRIAVAAWSLALTACATAPEEPGPVAVVPAAPEAVVVAEPEPAPAPPVEKVPPKPVVAKPVAPKPAEAKPAAPAPVYTPQPARSTSSSSSSGKVWVNGYCRKDGRCVSGYWRNAPRR